MGSLKNSLTFKLVSYESDFIRHHYRNSPTIPCRDQEITLRGFDPPMRVVNSVFVFVTELNESRL